MPWLPAIECHCLQCGRSFSARPHVVRRGGGKYCSNHCRNQPGPHRPPSLKRHSFDEQVRKTDTCWIWIGPRTTRGYGRFRLYRREIRAHRFAYEQAYGPIPEGLDVLHHCDNPPCVRPDHFFLGSNAENSADCLTKGRQAKGDHIPSERRARGSRNGNAKLKEAQVIEIRKHHADGKANESQLAKEYSVSQAHISAIVLGKVWKHL